MDAAVPRSRVRLAQALKDALETTPLDRITVSGLSARAGIHRQTFYAQFSDVYDLAEWVFETEVADHIMAHAGYDQWADGFVRMLVYMKGHHDQVYAVLHALTAVRLEHFFYHWLHEMMRVIVDEIGDGFRVAPADRDFVVDHFTLAVLGHLLHWFATDMRDDPYVLVSNLEFILHGSLRASLLRFANRGWSPSA